MRIVRSILLAVIHLAGFSVDAVAQPSLPTPETFHCGNTLGVSNEEIISACNAAIDGGLGDPAFRARYHSVRGRAHLEQDEPARAIADLDVAIGLDPQHISDFLFRGRAYMVLRLHDRAIADFDQLTWKDPDDPRGYLLRGDAYSASGQYARAIDDFGRAILLLPEYIDAVAAYRGRAQAYRALGQAALAAADDAKITELIRNTCRFYIEQDLHALAALLDCAGQVGAVPRR